MIRTIPCECVICCQTRWSYNVHCPGEFELRTSSSLLRKGMGVGVEVEPWLGKVEWGKIYLWGAKLSSADSISAVVFPSSLVIICCFLLLIGVLVTCFVVCLWSFYLNDLWELSKWLLWRTKLCSFVDFLQMTNLTMWKCFNRLTAKSCWKAFGRVLIYLSFTPPGCTQSKWHTLSAVDNSLCFSISKVEVKSLTSLEWKMLAC